ncbi:disulfide bond formation protein D, selenocysteine-containing [Thiosulfatimonas sediminis]|uniref:Disulfide bond formation protein D, selenocysteine-containing n=1 Tax=Thiosulfatimonas sediminis TaxID=2675054 RepID=A0A6F8PUQ9_9GAMM|nr:thioredoxin domain-containing protein [Thiosulfatimonas sediminis]BBP45882.1 disulfide bond formation protein D, selenocysteine-containing [Thiosulfatimonas sediminis]
MKRNSILAGLVVLVGVFMTAYVLQSSDTTDLVEDSLVRPYSPVIGPADAKVTLVEFIDPACEACRAMYPYVKEILSENPEQIRLVIRYVDFHAQSKQAIEILEAARKQNQFSETLELLLGFQPVWAPHGHEGVDLWEILPRGNLDLSQARVDVQSAEIALRIAQDEQDRLANGVKKTPGFFVNGKPLTIMHPDVLREMIAAELAASTL